ncbi:MAG: hypothetical protein ACI9DK_001359 [Vicingaceae bacterium]|jgi:hypothetical protein
MEKLEKFKNLKITHSESVWGGSMGGGYTHVCTPGATLDPCDSPDDQIHYVWDPAGAPCELF